MKIETLNIKGCNREISVEIPWNEIDKKATEIAKDIKKIAVIDGFRRGKIPVDYIKKVFAKDIKEEILKDVIPSIINNYLKQENIKLASDPEIYNVIYVDQCPVTFNVAMEIMPNIVPQNYKGIEIKKPEIIVSDLEIEERINKLRHHDAVLQPIEDREIREGDYVGIKILSPDTLFNEEIDKNRIYNFMVGKEEINIKLNNLVKGMKLNEIREIEFDDLDEQDKKKILAIQVVEIKEIKLANLEDLYKNKEGINNIEEYKELIKKELFNEKEKNLKSELKRKIIDHLLEYNKFDIPISYLRAQLNLYYIEKMKNLNEKGIALPIGLLNLNENIDNLKTEAEKEVKKRFILDAIAEVENIELSEEEIDKKIENIAKELGQNPIAFKGKLQARKDYKYIVDEWRRDKALDFLLQDAKII